ncbi:hypothetical protein VTJ83DRAFT_6753 [Remersonia thermophila]|uniref:Survival Motor Neuron Gemin2-binding domain-containing protein n=1 Tax=Remersonia thermophila TaxID=72144 RepID=A0ABR4D5L3_9PEZI
MEPETAATHDEIWDDSALVNSWNEALEEYKKYHSIHLSGGNIDEILDQAANGVTSTQPSGTAKLETTQPNEEGLEQNEDETSHPPISDVQSSGNAETASKSGEKPSAGDPAPTGMGPQMLLGNVQDEELKKLLMSWYYAGYYTGLYEGRQQGLRQAAEQAPKEKSA